MYLLSKVRSSSLPLRRMFSTASEILNPSDPETPLTAIQKSRAAVALIPFETNPERVLDICRAAELTPALHLDRVAFSKAIDKLKMNNYYEGIRGLIKDSLTGPDCRSDRFFSHFIVMYGQAGLIKDAVKLFDEMPERGVERSTRALNALLFACVLGPDYGEMKRVFKDFPGKYGLKPDIETYNTVLKGLGKSGSATSAYSVLSDMERNGVKPDKKTFAVVLEGFYREKKFVDVDKVIGLMKKYNVKQGKSIYNCRIHSLCKLERSNEAKALLDEMLTRKIKPDSTTYAHLIYGFCREGNSNIARSLFDEMVNRKLKPEAESYFRLVYYLSKGKDFEGSLTFCKQSIEKGRVPYFKTMKRLVEGLVSIGKIDEAKELIEVVKKFSRNAHKWSEIEEGLVAAN